MAFGSDGTVFVLDHPGASVPLALLRKFRPVWPVAPRWRTTGFIAAVPRAGAWQYLVPSLPGAVAVVTDTGTVVDTLWLGLSGDAWGTQVTPELTVFLDDRGHGEVWQWPASGGRPSVAAVFQVPGATTVRAAVWDQLDGVWTARLVGTGEQGHGEVITATWPAGLLAPPVVGLPDRTLAPAGLEAYAAADSPAATRDDVGQWQWPTVPEWHPLTAAQPAGQAYVLIAGAHAELWFHDAASDPLPPAPFRDPTRDSQLAPG